MNRHQLIFFLVILLGISSCDMSRWYFRHGGKKHAVKSQAETSRTVEFSEGESAQSITRDSLFLSIEDVTITPQEKVDSPENTLIWETTSKNPEVTTASSTASEKVTETPRSDQRPSLASAKRMHTNPGPFILLLILVFILGLALIAALIFLISWIFVPVALALRIALWGVMIAFGVYLLLFLGLILFSD